MRKRFLLIWFLTFFLSSSLLAWRLTVIHNSIAIASRPDNTTLAPDFPPLLTNNQIKKQPTAPIQHLRPGFMDGIIFPQWGKDAYSVQNSAWNYGLQDIELQTNAGWLSLPITFHQKSASSTVVETRSDIPSPQALAASITQARHYGYKVFIYPLMTVDGVNTWAGQIDFSSQADANAWFASYWKALSPYMIAANQAGAEQFSIGNEFELLEGHFDPLWEALVNKTHEKFKGHVVYSINWSSLQYLVPGWLGEARLDAIGVSTYFSLVDTPQHLDQPGLVSLWQQRVGSKIDRFAKIVQKPVFLSEMGYRNTSDAGYLPYRSNTGTHAPRDDNEQAYLFEAALQSISQDHAITGVFVWAWNIAPYSPDNKPAANVINKWFTIL